EQLVEQTATSKEEMLLKIKQWYNGYRFEENAQTVYNPVSLAQFFRNKGKFNNYWFQTGTPKFLLDLIKEKKFNCAAALNEPVSAAFFNAFEISNLDPMILLYQTGYLTIEKAVDEPVPFTDQTMRLYYMHFPNREVESSFNDCLLEYYAAVKQQDAAKLQLDLVSAVGHGSVDEFMKILQTMFANIPYDIHCKEEFYYQSLFYLICYMLQVYVQAEVRTNDGRIDMTIQAGDWIYVIEFKLNKSAEEAMKQIKDKDYAQKFQRDGKRIMLIGVNFNSESGQIENWISEELKN
ncbi:MAG: AAA family ATPase, partial [Alphaproteobacteria bacterium]|nr:AAA family ATPase [Alphaproteobacteria bacterium]